mgnify:FL=1
MAEEGPHEERTRGRHVGKVVGMGVWARNKGRASVGEAVGCKKGQMRRCVARESSSQGSHQGWKDASQARSSGMALGWTHR